MGIWKYRVILDSGGEVFYGWFTIEAPNNLYNSGSSLYNNLTSISVFLGVL